MIQEIRVSSKYTDVRGDALLKEIKRTLGLHSLQAIRTAKVYRFQGIDDESSRYVAQQALIDPLNELFLHNEPFSFPAHTILEVGNKPGVMNPEAASLEKVIQALGINSLLAVQTSWEYYFSGSMTEEQLAQICDRLLVNKTVAQIIRHKPSQLLIQGTSASIRIVPLSTMSHEEFKTYAKKQQLFLSDGECGAIQSYFAQLGRDPYDAELETIAQTWSEHCSHKTFKAPFFVDGVEKKPLFTRLKETAALFAKDIVSAFEDNAGVFRFYDGYAIAGKVETHNSPSAIEPYGGAATGSGGVFRDIMGTGQGAHVIASTDIFCFAPPTLPAHHIPPGCLHPDYILRRVVAGVRDYGNRMGIPTNNGSIHFHPDFCAKPTVIVGAYGLIPEERCKKGVPHLEDRIFVVGGKTGRDGIHGATFSSDSMTDQTSTVNATAVQIGNPIEQKRMADALLAARDANIIRAITDCGAGGFSSAVGEMAHALGAHVELSQAPLKYSGLAPWEIWVSESQERMVCAIAPEHTDQFIKLCELYNVTATDIGFFTGTKKLVVTYHGKTVCDLDMSFLHNGCPIVPLQARAPQKMSKPRDAHYLPPANAQEWITRFTQILAHGTICSKESIVRQYDHTVQGMNALLPYAGLSSHGPQDATVLTPLYGKPYSLIISHGLNPILNRINPYAGSLWVITEALANLVAVGGNPRDAALIDNFIWPKPHQELLWALDQSLQACVDAMKFFQIPFISGKDSLSSTYQFPDGKKLEIPPVLCVSAFGKIPDVSKTISSDIKHRDSLLLLVGELDVSAMGGSVYEQILGYESDHVPIINGHKAASVFEQLHRCIDQRLIAACHDVSEGGIAVAVAEMCFGGKKGAVLDYTSREDIRPDHFLFNETAGCFIVEVDRDDYHQGYFNDLCHVVIGRTTEQQSLHVIFNNTLLFTVDVEILYQAWKKPMDEVFAL
jgi:phosphoribosylformylglycinamidine synthase subunit PurSL